MIMFKTQDTALSSSRRVMSMPQPPDDHHHPAKSVGCMSGIFHLLSRHRHRRKFLTSGKKQEKVAQHPASIKLEHRTNHQTITKVSSSQGSPNNNSSIESNMNAISWEARRKLKCDLERCDEDLKELKTIIESIRYSETDRSSLPPSVLVKRTVVDEKCGRRRDHEHIKYSIVNEHTIPVSVLDDFTRSSSSSIYSGDQTTTKYGRVPAPLPQVGVPRKKDEATYESLFVQKVMIESVRVKREAGTNYPLPRRSSKAMIESVEEVCRDISWGEKRDVGRIGLVIQDYICRDLIEEFVKDLGYSYKSSNFHSLPFQACKRKLCF